PSGAPPARGTPRSRGRGVAGAPLRPGARRSTWLGLYPGLALAFTSGGVESPRVPGPGRHPAARPWHQTVGTGGRRETSKPPEEVEDERDRQRVDGGGQLPQPPARGVLPERRRRRGGRQADLRG